LHKISKLTKSIPYNISEFLKSKCADSRDDPSFQISSTLSLPDGIRMIFEIFQENSIFEKKWIFEFQNLSTEILKMPDEAVLFKISACDLLPWLLFLLDYSALAMTDEIFSFRI
jgi:hypothetical protein